MKIAVVGRGNVGGGLAKFWRDAGHEVNEIGKEGGDVSGADATNLIGNEPPSGFQSNAEFLKSKTNGPTAKSFNLNFARAYEQLKNTRARPSNIWTGDEEARAVVEQLNRDAGYEPVYAGGLENARAQEAMLGMFFAINQNGLGPFVYRMAPPDKL